MKVLLINKFLYPKGGAEISILVTGKILEAHGHEVVFWGMAASRKYSVCAQGNALCPEETK
jgi:hypothetical protein